MHSFSDFVETPVGIELVQYIKDCIELNRDILDGSQRLIEAESDEKLRGRNAQCRDILSYIQVRIDQEIEGKE